MADLLRGGQRFPFLGHRTLKEVTETDILLRCEELSEELKARLAVLLAKQMVNNPGDGNGDDG
jgi:hypothetical protein